MVKYLDYAGLSYFWGKLKGYFVAQVEGKGLSTEDYTTAEKTKLAGIAEGAEVNVQADWNQSVNSADDYIKNKPTLGALAAKDEVAETDLESTLATKINNKVDKEAGKGLSTNDFDNTYKGMLDNLSNDLDDKADKVASATSGNFAGLDGNGNLTDSGSKAADFATAAQGTKADNAIPSAEKGANNGVAPLNASGIIDAQYLPSYVDDVIEAYPVAGKTELAADWLASGSASGPAITGEAGKIYVLMADSTNYATNTQFRWGGSAYVKMNDGGVTAITTSEIDTIVAS